VSAVASAVQLFSSNSRYCAAAAAATAAAYFQHYREEDGSRPGRCSFFFIVSSGQKEKREGEAALRYSREAKSSCRPSSRATHALVMICSRCRSRLVPFTLSITIYPPCNIVAAASVVVVAIIIKQEKKKSYFFFPTSFPRKNTLSFSHLLLRAIKK